jgi:hypothetical protein
MAAIRSRALEAYLAYLPDEELPELAFYCPDCAEREFKRS